MVISFKQFEFDYETMQRKKINDYCEFPETIDFKPWTAEGIEEQERKKEKQGKSGKGKKASDEMMDGLESPDQDDDDVEVEDDDISEGQQSDEDDGSCGRFSENDAIESSEHSNAEAAEEVKSQNGFEELIGYTQDEEDQVDKGQPKKAGSITAKNRPNSLNISQD